MEHYSTREEKCGLQTLPPMRADEREGVWLLREKARGGPNKKLRGPAKNNTASQKLWRVYISETLYPGRKIKT